LTLHVTEARSGFALALGGGGAGGGEELGAGGAADDIAGGPKSGTLGSLGTLNQLSSTKPHWQPHA